MKKWKFILALLCLTYVADVCYAAPVWEYVSAYHAADNYDDSDRIDVTVKDGYIYINTPKPVTVKVMSIVGQLISQQNLPAGESRLKVNSRGIYILKAGTLTLRVSV